MTVADLERREHKRWISDGEVVDVLLEWGYRAQQGADAHLAEGIRIAQVAAEAREARREQREREECKQA